jgi:signal transduction histidine kinase
VAAKDIGSPASPDGDYCRISVRDNGIGFNEIYLDKIFTIFQRLNSREKYEGTGIGLAIVKKIIDKHNGLISARSAVNSGSTFIIVLPVRQQPPPAAITQ